MYVRRNMYVDENRLGYYSTQLLDCSSRKKVGLRREGGGGGGEIKLFMKTALMEAYQNGTSI